MRKKILYCASTVSHILNFHLPYLQYFHEMGWQVDAAAANPAEIPYADNVIALPLEKNLLSLGNLKAIYYTTRLLANNRYDIISIHTTLAGAVLRLAAQIQGKKLNAKVVYTSHGYFFNEDGGLSQRPYLLAEKILAPVTDVLMVMNNMDRRLADQHRLSKNIIFIPGMGLDIEKFTRFKPDEKKKLKVSAGFDSDDFLIVYAAEMSRRKNQGELIRAFSLAAAQNPKIKLLLAGDGELKEAYTKIALKSGFGDRIFFLGYVADMISLYRICDLAVSTSRCEGLPFNVMEAMASGLPVIASQIKGHTDLLESQNENCLYELGHVQTLGYLIQSYFMNQDLRERAGQMNLLKVEKYSQKEVLPMITNIYSELI